MLSFLEKELTLTGNNIDERYFEQTDTGGYKATPLLKYIIARDAKKYFSRIIEKQDNGTYESCC